MDHISAISGRWLSALGMLDRLAAEIGGVDFLAGFDDRPAHLPGAGEQVVQRITQLAPQIVSYVSCDPATLARDLRFFIDRGYQLRSIVALDLFPQTFHVETVARLEYEC